MKFSAQQGTKKDGGAGGNDGWDAVFNYTLGLIWSNLCGMGRGQIYSNLSNVDQ